MASERAGWLAALRLDREEEVVEEEEEEEVAKNGVGGGRKRRWTPRMGRAAGGDWDGGWARRRLGG